MKLKKFIVLTLVSVSMLFIGCDKKDDEVDPVNFSAEDANRAAQVDNTVEGTLSIMENGYVEGEEGRSQNMSFFPTCTEITILPNGDGGTIILDFGDSCELNNGALVSGIINLEFGAFIQGSRTIIYTFENFVYNGNGVTGGGEILREIANQNGNPSSTVNETITVSFPNTTVTATRNGLRIAEWVEGVGSGTWLDNVYHISGNWDTTFTNGFERTGEVTETLVRKLSCIYLVRGVIIIQQEGLTGEIDFGDGICDNLAILRFNGEEYPIIL